MKSIHIPHIFFDVVILLRGIAMGFCRFWP